MLKKLSLSAKHPQRLAHLIFQGDLPGNHYKLCMGSRGCTHVVSYLQDLFSLNQAHLAPEHIHSKILKC